MQSADPYAAERALLAKYRAELQRAQMDATNAQERIERYQPVVRGLEGVIPDEAPSRAPVAPNGDDAATAEQTKPRRTNSSGPRGEEAVKRVLMEHPGEGMQATSITRQLHERDWISPGTKDPVAATRAAANRLRVKDTRFRFENGFYVFQPEADTNGPATYAMPIDETET